jgi:hypothetical protein
LCALGSGVLWSVGVTRDAPKEHPEGAIEIK